MRMDKREKNAWLREHHYRWRKNPAGEWRLIGPDGYPTTEEKAISAIELQRKHTQSPQEWARSMLEKRPLVLDTETCGLESSHEVIEIALIELDGTVAMNTLIQCQGPISEEASKLHGITKATLAEAPMFPEVWRTLLTYRNREIIIYNAGFDIPMLAWTATRYQVKFPKFKSHCLMIQFFRYAMMQKEEKDAQNYRSLEAACSQLGITIEDAHRALADAQAARALLCCLAELS